MMSVRAVAIHIVGVHLRTAAAEGRLVERPRRDRRRARRAVSHHPSFSMMSMRPSPFTSPTPMPCVKFAVFVVLRNGVEFPRPRRVAPVGCGVAVLAFGDADQFGFSVAR